MNSPLSTLRDLHPGRTDRAVRARVIRLWLSTSTLIPARIISIGFILLDSEGNKIYGIVHAEHVDRYLRLLVEERVYLFLNCHVAENRGVFFPTDNPNMMVLDSVTVVVPSRCEVIHVIGVLTCVRYEASSSSTRGLDVVVKFCLVDDSGEFRCSLRGEYVEKFQSLFREGDPRLLVFVMQFVKIGQENGELVVEYVGGVSRMLLNPPLRAVYRLRTRLENFGRLPCIMRDVSAPGCVVPLRYQFHGFYHDKSLGQLLTIPDDGPFVVCAAITGLERVHMKMFAVCSCGGSLVLSDGVYYCFNCRVSMTCVKFGLRFDVSDGLCAAAFGVFDDFLGGVGALNFNAMGIGYALYGGGAKILKDRPVVLIVRRCPVGVTVAGPAWEVLAITNDVVALRKKKSMLRSLVSLDDVSCDLSLDLHDLPSDGLDAFDGGVVDVAGHQVVVIPSDDDAVGSSGTARGVNYLLDVDECWLLRLLWFPISI
ncbi:uncharacterized protein LOC123922920 [Trifolium pratense]|uniref:uncharacterized protein LOC123922920 n=1 Tax=Trifolium pratense TaxID=57577 RepID=UPI001E6957AE|nr:uncharacterized protein LOC123922920 [Trifolium pratense]